MAIHKKLVLILTIVCVILAGCGGHEDIQGIDSGSALNGSGDAFVSPLETQLGDSGPSAVQTPGSTGIPPEKTGRGLMIDRELIFDINYYDESEDGGICVGVQFYRGEPVMLWLKAYKTRYSMLSEGEYRYTEPITLYPDCGLYLRRADGEQELLIPGGTFLASGGPVVEELDPEEGNPNAFARKYRWYVDEEGCCYCALVCSGGQEDTGRGHFLKLDQAGELLYRTALEPGFQAEGFCALNEEMYVSVAGEAGGSPEKRLVEFDPDTGSLSETAVFVLEENAETGSFGSGPEGLYLYDAGAGIQKIGPEEGDVSGFLSFAGSTYSRLGNTWEMQDFRVLEDGSVQALYLCIEEGGYIGRIARGIEERLETVEGRETVTLRAASISGWLRRQAAGFNKSNTAYWVVLEEQASSRSADLADYAKLTSVALAAGKGPDILCGNLIGDYVQGMIDKGALLELGELMEASGIQEEDYLQPAFGSWRTQKAGIGETGIYGVNPYVSPRGYKMRRDVLDGDVLPDIRTLMDALDRREEGAVYYAYLDAGRVLELFLEGTEDLWGMVDWERGTCDFGGGLLAQILQAAERYGYDGTHNYQTLVRRTNFGSIYQYDSLAELEAEGMVRGGVLFDDGCHGAVDSSCTLAVNAASGQKEGAWAFLCYLLGAEAQTQLDGVVPVNRAALGSWVQSQLEEAGRGEVSLGGSYVDEGEVVKFSKTYTSADLTPERVEEYLAALEDVRVLPFATGPILDIIYEEAGAYFDGSRAVDDVIGIIQNRVQLYLDENR